jgi:hypothetical protein
MSANTETVKRVLELFNQLPGDQEGTVVRIQTFFDHESARPTFDAL